MRFNSVRYTRLIPAKCLVLLACAGLFACRKETVSLPVFRELNVPTRYDLTAVWFTDSLHGLAAGGSPWTAGELFSTTDAGRSWQLDTVVNNRLECVMADPSGQAYACGMDGLVLHRPAGLPYWYTLRVDFTWNRGCYFQDDHHGVVVVGEGFQGGAARKLGPEALWLVDTLQTFPNALSAVWYSDSITVHAVGLGWVLRSDDGGRSWTRLEAGNDFFRSVHFPTPETGYICGHSGTLLKTVDAGRSWQQIREGGPLGKKHQPFRAVWFVTADKGYLVGDGGLLWRTRNGGADWEALSGLPESADASDIFVLYGRGWITADGGRMFYFEE